MLHKIQAKSLNDDCCSWSRGFKYEVWNNSIACCSLTFSTHACCDNRLADQEKGKIPGREGNLVKRICNSRTCTHTQTSLHSMHMAVGMNACSCGGIHTHTHTNTWLYPTSIWQTATRRRWPSSTTFHSPMTFTWRTGWDSVKTLKRLWKVFGADIIMVFSLWFYKAMHAAQTKPKKTKNTSITLVLYLHVQSLIWRFIQR